MERFHIALRLRGRIVRKSRSPAVRVRLFLGASLSVEPISNLRGRALEVPLGGNANEAQTQKRRHFGARKRAPHRVVLLCVPLFHAASRLEDGRWAQYPFCHAVRLGAIERIFVIRYRSPVPRQPCKTPPPCHAFVPSGKADGGIHKSRAGMASRTQAYRAQSTSRFLFPFDCTPLPVKVSNVI